MVIDRMQILHLRDVAMATPFCLSMGYNFSCMIARDTLFDSKGRQNFLRTDIKNLSMQKLRLAAVYRRAKFRDDKTTFTNIKADIFKTPLPPIDSSQKPY